MSIPAKLENEVERLQTLRSLQILDTPPEERFDRLTRLAKRLFGVPIALVSLVDENRQWFKSRDGLDVCETPRDISFCGHALLGDDILMVADARQDQRFFDSPLVTDHPNVRFYAGVPLRVENGSKLGTLCLMDVEPRTLDNDDRALLHDLATMAERELAAVQLATMDELTHISNRRGFHALAQHSLHMCARVGRDATLFFFDMDHFKQINDRFGHAEGDRALQAFATILRQTFRESDVIGRLGGDEFVVLSSNQHNGAHDAMVARLADAVSAHNQTAGRGYALSYSVGTVPFDPLQHDSIDQLLHQADSLMYANKLARRS